MVNVIRSMDPSDPLLLDVTAIRVDQPHTKLLSRLLFLAHFIWPQSRDRISCIYRIIARFIKS